ncbi:MAG TPA: energy transducer TonB [Allosphingosinicella sp.]|jgi:protein TonB
MAGSFTELTLILGAAAGAAAAWGAPPPGVAVSTPSKLRAGTIGAADYPADALAARAEGRTLVRYTVGFDGRAANCAVLATSGHASLDAAACALVQRRFRFSPAQDASGKPVSETRTDVVAWALPEAPAPAASGKPPASD